MVESHSFIINLSSRHNNYYTRVPGPMIRWFTGRHEMVWRPFGTLWGNFENCLFV